MYEIHENKFINPKQITRTWLDIKRDRGKLGDYSGSYDRTYYIVKVELSSGAIYEIEFNTLSEALERLQTIVGKVG